MTKTIHILYYASLRETRGANEETLTTSASTAGELYKELQARYGFALSEAHIQVAINHEMRTWHASLTAGDTVTFIPPVAGG